MYFSGANRINRNFLHKYASPRTGRRALLASITNYTSRGDLSVNEIESNDLDGKQYDCQLARWYSQNWRRRQVLAATTAAFLTLYLLSRHGRMLPGRPRLRKPRACRRRLPDNTRRRGTSKHVVTHRLRKHALPARHAPLDRTLVPSDSSRCPTAELHPEAIGCCYPIITRPLISHTSDDVIPFFPASLSGRHGVATPSLAKQLPGIQGGYGTTNPSWRQP